MYHAIVKRFALKNFLRVNRKDYATILKSCSPDVHHRFGGHHALGGERHDREALGRWFERLGRLAPTLQVSVHQHHKRMGRSAGTVQCYRRSQAARRRRAALSCLRSALSRRSSTR
jgi:hypothetical protein